MDSHGTQIHRGEISYGKARELAKLAIDPSHVTAVTQTAPSTTQYFDEIRILSRDEGLRGASSIAKAANLVREGVEVEDAAEESRKDYAKRISKRRARSPKPWILTMVMIVTLVNVIVAKRI